MRITALNASDVAVGGQEPCVCSRFTFTEATPDEANRYCETLAEQIDLLRIMDDEFAAFGVTDRRGVAIRTEEPVDFHPLRKTSNRVCVPDLMDATKYANVTIQTVGVYPFERMSQL